MRYARAALVISLMAIGTASFAQPEWKTRECDRAGMEQNSRCRSDIDRYAHLGADKNHFWTVNEATSSFALSDEEAYVELCRSQRERENDARIASENLLYKLNQGGTPGANMEAVKRFVAGGNERDLQAIAKAFVPSSRSTDIRRTVKNAQGNYYFEADHHDFGNKEMDHMTWEKYFLSVEKSSKGRPTLVMQVCTYLNPVSLNNGKAVGNFTDDCVKVDMLNHEIIQHTKLPDTYQPAKKFSWKERFPRASEQDWLQVARENKDFHAYDCLVSHYNLNDPLTEIYNSKDSSGQGKLRAEFGDVFNKNGASSAPSSGSKKIQ